MLIPLGSARTRRVLPAATIALIAVNTVVFLATRPRAERDEHRLGQALLALREEEEVVEARHPEATTDTPDWVHQRFGIPTDSEQAFWDAFSAGTVAEAEPGERQEWLAARAKVESAREETLVWQWGFRLHNPNPLSLLTSMFLHGGVEHLVGNMLFLWAAGVGLEEVWGVQIFLLLYFLGGLAAEAAEAVTHLGVDRPALGASGAIASLMGAFMIRHFATKVAIWTPFLPLKLRVRAGYLLPIWFYQQVRDALDTDPSAGGVARWAHVGGFVVGVAVAVGIRALGVEKKTLAPAIQAQDLAAERAATATVLERTARLGTATEFAAALAAAVKRDPTNVALRRQELDFHLKAGHRDDAARAGPELLRSLWQAGDRAAYVEVLRQVDASGLVPLEPALLYRAAQALEPRAPQEAAALLYRVAAEAPPADPVRAQALTRYATVLERLGEHDKAAQVRTHLGRTP